MTEEENISKTLNEGNFAFGIFTNVEKEFADVNLKVLPETLKQSDIWRIVQVFICINAAYIQRLWEILQSSNLVPCSIH